MVAQVDEEQTTVITNAMAPSGDLHLGIHKMLGNREMDIGLPGHAEVAMVGPVGVHQFISCWEGVKMRTSSRL